MSTSSENDRVCVVLVSTRNPLNIGAAARAMSNFGFSDLRVVNPYEPSFREARSAVGAQEVLNSARVYTSVADAVTDCVFVVGTTSGARRDIQSLELLETGAKALRKRLHTGKVAILFGSEKRGLSNDDLSHCDLLLRIPTREEHGSMNLGQAVAVCLYELAREGWSEKPSKKTPSKTAASTKASAGDLERIAGLLTETLRSSGYTDERREGSAEEKVRRLVRRLELSQEDAKTWLGMVRQILWKLNQSR